MLTFMRSLWYNKRGNALLIAAGALPLLIGSAGIAVDTVQWAVWKRQLQRAADSAAIAGAYAKKGGQNVSAAVTLDLGKNNYVGFATTSTVNNPPTTGSYTADANAVNVALVITKQLSFSSVFTSTPTTIKAAATATNIIGDYCVVSLEPGTATGLSAGGSTTLNLGCGMHTNSSGPSAAVEFGAATVVASPIAAVGGITGSWTGTLIPNDSAMADPFAGVSPPTLPSPCNTALTLNNGSANYTGGGCYTSMNIKGTATFGPGVYYINGGDITMNGNGAIIATQGTTFVLTNSSAAANATIGGVKMNGNGDFSVVAPDTGWSKGIAIYQDRRATAGNSVTWNGTAASKIQGALYFPKANVTFTGNQNMDVKCMQLVGQDITFTGNSNVTNVCPLNSASGSFKSSRMRLVE